MRPSRKQAGFALAELIITLGIGVLITAGVWAAYSERRAIAKGTSQGMVAESLMDIADTQYAFNIGFVSDVGTAQPLSLDRLVAAAGGEVPRGIFEVGGAYQNTWGGAWVVQAESTDGGTTLDLVVVETTQVPPAECQVMVNQLAPFIYDTRVNGDLVRLEPAEGAPAGVRTTVDFNALALCDEPANTLRMRRLKALDLSTLRRIRPYPDGLTDEEQGIGLNDRYRISFASQHARIEAALDAREQAQVALDGAEPGGAGTP